MQKRISEVDDLRREYNNNNKNGPFQADSLTVLWFPCWAIWTESGLELC